MKKLYIVHGWTYSLDKWNDLLTELSSHEIDPVMLKVPGLSEPSDEVWTIEKYVEWLESELKDEKDVLLLGHSNGGRIAMAYDVVHPGKLKHLILLDSAGIPRTDNSTSLKRKVAKPIAGALKPITPAPVRRKLYRMIGAADYGNAKPNMQKTMQNVLAHDETFDPTAVQVPSTLIWGSEDAATPLEHGEKLKQLLPNVTDLHVIDDAKHSPHATHTQQVSEIVVQTLEAM